VNHHQPAAAPSEREAPVLNRPWVGGTLNGVRHSVARRAQGGRGFTSRSNQLGGRQVSSGPAAHFLFDLLPALRSAGIRRPASLPPGTVARQARSAHCSAVVRLPLPSPRTHVFVKFFLRLRRWRSRSEQIPDDRTYDRGQWSHWSHSARLFCSFLGARVRTRLAITQSPQFGRCRGSLLPARPLLRAVER
jgi:hypothetical protein